MKIELDLTKLEIADLLLALTEDRSLHLKIIEAITVPVINMPKFLNPNWFNTDGTISLNEAIRTGKKIQAIKIVKNHTNLGLREAKDVIDSIM